MKCQQKEQGKGPLETVEEAVHLLRLAPATALLKYYLGTLPFALGLLYFWTDLGRGAFAERRLLGLALGLACLFVWMKAWQSVFAGEMAALAAGQTPPTLHVRVWLRLAATQGLLQSTGLFVLPAALLAFLPAGYAYAFYQNLTVLQDVAPERARDRVRRAFRQAALWPAQNHYGLIILKAFGLFVFLNLYTGLAAGPFLLKTLLGVESVFSRSWTVLLNPTVAVAVAVLTHLCLDPLAKTFFVLRCFYGEALHTGEDLKAELRLAASGASVLALAAVGLLLSAPCAGALEAPPAMARLGPTALGSTAPAPGIAPAELDEAIRRTLDRPEFRWRLPREKAAGEPQKGSIALFVESLVETVRDWAAAFARWVRKVGRWLTGEPMGPVAPGASGAAWLSVLHSTLIALILGLAGLVAVMLLRLWKRRGGRRNPPLAAEPVAAAPNVADEAVGPDQLPTDGWSRLGAQLLEQGELRLALRAYYLGSLAFLAERNLIVLARFKSNRDYERELERRGHALPEVVRGFGANVAVFDRGWYGLHEVSRETLDLFLRNLETIRAGAAGR